MKNLKERGIIKIPNGVFGIKLVGVKYRPQVYKKVKSDSIFTLEREPDNKTDKNAIKILLDGEHVGYVGRKAFLALRKLDILNNSQLLNEFDNIKNLKLSMGSEKFHWGCYLEVNNPRKQRRLIDMDTKQKIKCIWNNMHFNSMYAIEDYNSVMKILTEINYQLPVEDICELFLTDYDKNLIRNFLINKSNMLVELLGE